jgi:3-hydroxyisobutyrate dehydrogenase-like beta-hydroxyacid dehydrogenase
MTSAVLGAGTVGTAVARRLSASGHDVTVWSRSTGRAADLSGAVSLVFVTVTDYAAVHEVLDRVDTSGRTVVVLCTGTPGDARAAAARVGEDYLDAGLQSSPDAIAAGDATILYSGSRSAYERHRATLALLGPPRFAGERPEAAAVWDLALFGLWYDAQLGLLRALDTVRDAGIDVAAFAETAGTQLGHVVAGVPATLAEMQQGVFPAGPADLAGHRTVLRHLIELRAGRRLGDGGLPDVVAALDALVAAGRRSDGLTATIG